jgi:DNA polymerase II large subunit
MNHNRIPEKIQKNFDQCWQKIENTEAFLAKRISLLKQNFPVDPLPKIESLLVNSFDEKFRWCRQKIKGRNEQVVEYILNILNAPENIRVGKDQLRFKISLDLLTLFTEGLTEDEICARSIRLALAILTERVTSVPFDGIHSVSIEEMDELFSNEQEYGYYLPENAGIPRRKKRYLSISYQPVIRAAGGTAQAISVALGEAIREKLNLDKFIYSEPEIAKISHEVYVYDREHLNLRYRPEPELIRRVFKKLGILITSPKTNSIYLREGLLLVRMPNKTLRAGMCLVLCEGLVYKYRKIQSFIKQNNLTFWGDYLDINYNDVNRTDLIGVPLYLHEILIGRPVFGYPNMCPSPRLVVGQNAATGYGCIGLSPFVATVLNNVIRYGTQLRLEYPAKAGNRTFNQDLDPPFVTLKNGVSLRATKFLNYMRIVGIHELGEILIPRGEFRENNYPIPAVLPSTFYYAAVAKFPDNIKERGLPGLNPKFYINILNITGEEFIAIRKIFVTYTEITFATLKINASPGFKKLLDKLLIPHTCTSILPEQILLEVYSDIEKYPGLNIEIPVSYLAIINYLFKIDIGATTLFNVNLTNLGPHLLTDEILGEVYNEPGFQSFNNVRVGFKMGRPEKARERERSHGETAGNGIVHFSKRNTSNGKFSLKKKDLNLTIKSKITFICTFCAIEAQESALRSPLNIDKRTPLRRCLYCKKPTSIFEREKIEKDFSVKEIEQMARDLVFTEKQAQYLKGLTKPATVQGEEGELFEKLILRAAYGLHRFRDGTNRYDATNLVLTSAVLKEINLSVQKAHFLGYHFDKFGQNLVRDDQEIILFYQDIVVPKSRITFLIKTRKFYNSLEQLYSNGLLQPFYQFEKPEDVIGALCVSLAPHILVGSLCRVIGYTDIQGVLGHPFFHRSKRRNCDGDEDGLMLLGDCYLNYSAKYLRKYRGADMDTPVIINKKLDLSSVDKEAYNIDFQTTITKEWLNLLAQPKSQEKVKRLEEFSANYKKIINKKFSSLLLASGTYPTPFKLFPLTLYSQYKETSGLVEKLTFQLSLAHKMIGLPIQKILERIMGSFIMADLTGNLKSFFKQKYRCPICARSYQILPRQRKCPSCSAFSGANLLLTIRKGGILKSKIIGQIITKLLPKDDYYSQWFKWSLKEREDLFGVLQEKEILVDKDDSVEQKGEGYEMGEEHMYQSSN